MKLCVQTMQHLTEKGKGAETDLCRESKTKTPELWILLHLFSDFFFSLGKFLRNVFHVHYILILIGLTISLTLWSRFRDLPSISAVKIEFKHFLCPPPKKKNQKKEAVVVDTSGLCDQKHFARKVMDYFYTTCLVRSAFGFFYVSKY